MSFSITVYGKPQPAGSKRGFVNPKTGGVIITDDAKGSRAWKQEVAAAAVKARDGLAPITGPVELVVRFYLKRPKAHLTSAGGVKRGSPMFHTVRPDATKLLRAIEDAMTGIAWGDDSQVAVQNVEKYWADPNEPECCEIKVAGL